jgi:hypothetical protein
VTLDDLTLDIMQRIEINADIGDVFRSVIHRQDEGSTNARAESMQMILEQWPGGRWFRDRGNGIGHLSGHVQVIRPPVLLDPGGPSVHVLPGPEPPRSEARTAAGRPQLTGCCMDGKRATCRHADLRCPEVPIRENTPVDDWPAASDTGRLLVRNVPLAVGSGGENRDATERAGGTVRGVASGYPQLGPATATADISVSGSRDPMAGGLIHNIAGLFSIWS